MTKMATVYRCTESREANHYHVLPPAENSNGYCRLVALMRFRTNDRCSLEHSKFVRFEHFELGKAKLADELYGEIAEERRLDNVDITCDTV